MIPWFLVVLFLFWLPDSSPQAQPAANPSSEAVLTEGNFTLTVTILDDTRGTGVAGAEVVMKLRRGFIFLGRQKKDLLLATDKNGRTQVRGLPKGKLELFIRLDQNTDQSYHADLQPGLKKSIQLKNNRYRVIIEWQLD